VPPACPAHLHEEAPEIELLLDHREDLVRARTEDRCRLRRHLHDLRPDPEIPTGFHARKQAEGRSRSEAPRCLKRHLARRVWRLLLDAERERSEDTVHAQRGLPTPRSSATA